MIAAGSSRSATRLAQKLGHVTSHVTLSLGAIATLALAVGGARAQPSPPDGLPGMELRTRLEAHLAKQRKLLERSPGHLGLIYTVDQKRLLEALAPVRLHRDGSDYVVGSETVPEPHGGGILALLLDHWQVNGRAARLDDRFPFAPTRRLVALRKLYEGYKRQIFLPVPGGGADAIAGRIPGTPQLARMRFRFPEGGRYVETDAYKLLGLLIAREPDFAAPWVDHVGQRLSVDLLMDHVRRYYLTGSYTQHQPADHGNLHLVELLLAHGRRARSPVGLNEIKARFLAVELARVEPGDAWSEVLGHHAESLGRLLATPDIAWQPDEKRWVRAWLAALELEHFRELDGIPLQHLSHLLLGLRLTAENGEKLE